MRMGLREKGFTLVELAIVMVIIGLMIGAVLKGQTMIDNARQKRLMSDLQGLTASYYSYLDMYNALPGDDPNAAGRWSVANGDGNGYIGNAAEQQAALQALRYARLISGDPTLTGVAARPRHPYGGAMFLASADFGDEIGRADFIFIQSLGGGVAGMIDLRLDDGIASTGSIRTTGTGVYTNANVNLQYIL